MSSRLYAVHEPYNKRGINSPLLLMESKPIWSIGASWKDVRTRKRLRVGAVALLHFTC